MMPLAIVALVATSTIGDAERAKQWHREAVEWERLALTCAGELRAERDRLARCGERLELTCPPVVAPVLEPVPISRYIGAGASGAALASGIATGLACETGDCRARGAIATAGLLALAIALLW